MNLKPGRMPIVDRPEWPPVPSILEVAIEGLGMDLEAAKGALDAPGGYEWINELAEASASSRKGET